MGKEIEAKFQLENISLFDKFNLDKIKEIKVLDIYFDNSKLMFGKQDKVLRLRKENDVSFIAYKGPREKHDDFIVREEIEPSISSFEEGFDLITNLGFVETAKIEKIRTYFKSNKFNSLSITLDKYPFIGYYVEIEGDESQVYDFIEEFGLDLSKTIKKNCSESFLDYIRRRNLKLENPLIYFTFEDELKLIDS